MNITQCIVLLSSSNERRCEDLCYYDWEGIFELTRIVTGWLE